MASRILVVDDVPTNVKLLEAILSNNGYGVVTAANGEEALERVAEQAPDLVLTDVQMPGIDGHEVVRRLRADPATSFLPIVMVTSSEGEDRAAAIEAGADDFVQKPFDRSELLARVASLARVKRYHDTVERQAEELARWNTELESRVAAQVAELERTSRLRRFLSPQLADLVMHSDDESMLDSHRREIVVMFCDLRGFTSFAETSEPEEVMGVLRDFHAVLGRLVHEHDGTLERFTGDGVMIFFNDPVPVEDPAGRAVRLSVLVRDRVRDLAEEWTVLGHDLALGIGIAQGFATLGRIGFEGRFDYAAIGSATNLAARLCADAGPWQILVTHRVRQATGPVAASALVGDLQLRGLSRPVRVYEITALTTQEVQT